MNLAIKINWKVKFPLVIYVAIFIHFIFWLTYSPNTAMDAKNYLRMIKNGESNLIHAPGYPYFFHFIFPVIKYFLESIKITSELSILYGLTFIQHAITVVVYYIFYKSLVKIFSFGVANLTIILLIFNWSILGFTSIIYPEWFQSKLLILFFCSLYFAYSSKIFYKKFIFYTLCQIIFLLSFLTKFNLLIIIVPYWLALYVDKISAQKRLIIFLITSLMGFLLLILFVIFYHYPSTGAYGLTYDKGWVLSDKIKGIFNGELPPKETGPFTKKLYLLSSQLPSGNSNETPMYDFKQINLIPIEQRKYYREQYYRIMNYSKSELDENLNSIDFPDAHTFYSTWNSIGYNVGLKESNNLLLQVYLEILVEHPGIVFTHVARLLYYSLTQFSYYPLFPLDVYNFKENKIEKEYYESTETYCCNCSIFVSQVNFGYVSLERTCPLDDINFGNAIKYYVWLPGSFFFTVLAIISMKTPIIIWSLIMGLGLILLIRQNNQNLVNIFYRNLYICLLLFNISFIAFSNTIYYFRWEKEYQQIAPLVALCVSISLVRVYFELFYLKLKFQKLLNYK